MDLTDGLERHPILCRNAVDDESTPQDFVYINRNLLPDELTDIKHRTPRGVEVCLVLRKDRNKGWCVDAEEEIATGRFICEYLGEVITTTAAENRLAFYDENEIGHALLVIREVLPSGSCLRTNLDGTHLGNIARFFNHNCGGGNLRVEIERDAEVLIPRVVFYAAVDIHNGEELTFFYAEDSTEEADSLTRVERCYCGSEKCSGILPKRSRT